MLGQSSEKKEFHPTLIQRYDVLSIKIKVPIHIVACHKAIEWVSLLFVCSFVSCGAKIVYFNQNKLVTKTTNVNSVKLQWIAIFINPFSLEIYDKMLKQLSKY